MNIFIPLLTGVLVGYALRVRGRQIKLYMPTNAALLLLIFLMGVKTGKVQINASWLLFSSILFAAFTVAGSVGMAILAGRGR